MPRKIGRIRYLAEAAMEYLAEKAPLGRAYLSRFWRTVYPDFPRPRMLRGILLGLDRLGLLGPAGNGLWLPRKHVFEARHGIRSWRGWRRKVPFYAGFGDEHRTWVHS